MASIAPQNRNGKIVGYRTSLGRGPDGKDRRKFHKTYEDAQAYIKSEQSENLGTGELHRQKAEIIFALQRLGKVNATINDAVEFYLKHGARKGNPTYQTVVDELLAEKTQVSRSPNYLTDLGDKFTTFGKHLGAETKLGDITSEQISKYVYVVRNGLSATTKANYLRVLSVLFNYGIKKQYLSINPCENVERPTKKFHAPKVLTPEDFTKLLDRCYQNKWHDRIAIFVLVGFCGIRVEEAQKLKWTDIDMENKKVMVPADVAKKARFRRNVIPANAMAWLESIYDARRKGLIIGANAKTLLASAIRFSHIGYSQNCLRHSFCSYALENGMPLADVVSMMGHAGSPAVIHSNYRNLVEPKAAKKWWAIVPSQSAA